MIIRVPEISVVMSVYNGASSLRASIESILVQEGIDFEFIIVNDGSTDESPEILEEYAVRDPRIRLIHQENQGLTMALLRGCDEARGEFIARQDNGDCSLPGRLQAQSELLHACPDMVLCVGGVDQVTDDGTLVGTIRLPDDIAKLTRLLRDEMMGVPAHGSVMFRRDAYRKAGGYQEVFYYAQDCDLWLRLAPLGTLGCVPKVIYTLNVGVGGISSSRQKLQQAFARLAQSAYHDRQSGRDDRIWLAEAARLREEALRERIHKPNRYDLAGAYYRLGVMLEQAGLGKSKAGEQYRRALKLCPWYWRVWRKFLC